MVILLYTVSYIIQYQDIQCIFHTSIVFPVIEHHIEALSRSECRVTIASLVSICCKQLTCDLPADVQYSFSLLITADTGGMITIHLDFSK